MSPRGLGPGKLREKTRPDGSIYHEFDYTDASYERRVLRLGSNKEIARLRAAQLIRERDLALAGLSTVTGREKPWSDVLHSYLGNLGLRAKAGYVRRAKANIERVLQGMRCRTLGDITLAKAQAWQATRMRTATAKTTNDDLGAVSTFLRWCVRGGLLGANPLAELQKAKGPQRYPRRALTEHELGRLLAAADALEEDAPGRSRNLLVRFLVKVGCRWGSAIQLTWSDFRAPDRHLAFRADIEKNGTARVFPVDAELEGLLEGFRSAAYIHLGAIPGPSDRILLSPQGRPWTAHGGPFRKWLYSAFAEAGIERVDVHGWRVGIHSLRHSFATRMLRAGVPLAKVAQLGGWKSTAVIERVYAHLTGDDGRDALALVPLPQAPGTAILQANCDLGGKEPKEEPPSSFHKSRNPKGLKVAPRAGLEPATQRLTADDTPPDNDSGIDAQRRAGGGK